MRTRAKPNVVVSTRVTTEIYERFTKVLEARERNDQPISIRDAVEFALLEWINDQELELKR